MRQLTLVVVMVVVMCSAVFGQADNRARIGSAFPIIDISTPDTKPVISFQELILFARQLGAEVEITTEDVFVAQSSELRFQFRVRLSFLGSQPFDGRGKTIEDAAFDVCKNILIQLAKEPGTASAH